MNDIIERLRIESRREPHEPIWREAIEEIEALRAEVAEWKRVTAAQGEFEEVGAARAALSKEKDNEQ